MALVAYDNSDSSDFEDDAAADEAVLEVTTKVSGPITPTENVENEAQSLFNLLPKPTTVKNSFLEEDDEFLHKKEVTHIVKPKAKITVPSLNDFKDVETSTHKSKPKTINGKKSGLLSLLPQPKNGVTVSTKSLIPHVISQKSKSNAVKKKEQLSAPIKKVESASKLLGIQYSDDESDNDDEVQTDFFSINKVVEIPVEELPLDIESKANTSSVHKTQQKHSRSIQSYFKQNEVDEDRHEVAGNSSESESYGSDNLSSNQNVIEESSNSNEIALDDEAILKLCGSRVKRKREDIQIVDVNQQEVLADAREWLLKGLMDDTTKRVSSSKKRGHEPTSQQKRKHQITYLAHQAKANEAELQNQWANNRVTKRKTQSKYGF